LDEKLKTNNIYVDSDQNSHNRHEQLVILSSPGHLKHISKTFYHRKKESSISKQMENSSVASERVIRHPPNKNHSNINVKLTTNTDQMSDSKFAMGSINSEHINLDNIAIQKQTLKLEEPIVNMEENNIEYNNINQDNNMEHNNQSEIIDNEKIQIKFNEREDEYFKEE
jgi:hypothetical protein